MILEDFVMLGKTVPEPNRDGRVFVCSAGYSPELRSLLRIYPLARHASPERWSISEIALSRNPRDNRNESWQIRGDRSLPVHEYVNERFHRIGAVSEKERQSMLSRCVISSVQEANGDRISLAIVEPEFVSLEFEHNPESPNSPQLHLFDFEPKIVEGAKRFAYIPHLRFRDKGGDHRLMLRDWGCFEFMRKHGDVRRDELRSALHLEKPCSLLIGNLNHHRNAWLVISVLHGLRESRDQPRLALEEAAE
jgi:hypothetical protein